MKEKNDFTYKISCIAAHNTIKQLLQQDADPTKVFEEYMISNRLKIDYDADTNLPELTIDLFRAANVSVTQENERIIQEFFSKTKDENKE